MYAASPMPKETQRRALATLRCDFTQMYGMTEAAPLVTQSTPEDHRRGAAGEETFVSRLDSAGAEVVGVQCEVRDPITGTPVADGQPGEILVRGPNVMLGYWRREDETRAVLTPDGWYRSGDMAYADDRGYLYIVDRLKDMIISGGENVYKHRGRTRSVRAPGGGGMRSVRRSRPALGRARARRRGCADGNGAGRAGVARASRADEYADLQGPPLSSSFASSHCRSPAPAKILKRELRAPYWASRERSVR